MRQSPSRNRILPFAPCKTCRANASRSGRAALSRRGEWERGVWGKRGDLGGWRIIKKKKNKEHDQLCVSFYGAYGVSLKRAMIDQNGECISSRCGRLERCP